MLTLKTPISKLVGVGPKTLMRVEKLGIEKVSDLIYYFPRAWADFSLIQPIISLRAGEVATIKAKILQIKNHRSPRKRMFITKAILEDDSGEIKAIFFNQFFLPKVLYPGTTWIFNGKVDYSFSEKEKVLESPQYEKEAIILPIYPETEGLTSKFLRKLTRPLLKLLDKIPEFLPREIIESENLISHQSAVKQIHFPDTTKKLEKAKERLAFEELFLISLRMLLLKKELQTESAPKINIDEKLLKKFVKTLPYKLTNAQRKSAWQIIKDINRKVPMNRLLEGDVGSGKTVVAAMAALSVIENGYQVVWLAPTEVLANQHYKNIKNLLHFQGVRVGLLTSGNKKADLEKDDLIIGTHAVIQKDVKFANLGLVIIDEQHRFGVKQRAYLRKPNPIYEVGANRLNGSLIPHFLSLTATPIPRTLALSLYGDLDLSIIDEMPKERKRVETRIISPHGRPSAYEFIRKQIKLGRQAFVICPLIESAVSHKMKAISLFDQDRKSVKAEYEKLSTQVFPDLKIGLLHGKMRPKEKEKVMRDFAKNKINILVSTAVVEVGIDIPNATVMMIEGAERFGLASLHQFRGRVGRSKYQSFCFLFTESWSENTRKRLGAMKNCYNGFELAEKDLQIRGPGELVGVRQSGIPDLKMASLSDIIMIKRARVQAEKIVNAGIENYPQLAKKLAEFEETHHLE